jgi:hypothetical protein
VHRNEAFDLVACADRNRRLNPTGEAFDNLADGASAS